MIPPHLPTSLEPTPNLTPQHLAQLDAARVARRAIDRAVKVARFDGWTIMVFAVFTILIGYSDPTSLLLGFCMGIVAWFELRSANRLKNLDNQALTHMALNQAGMAAMLAAYGFWRLYLEYTGRGLSTSLTAVDPALADAGNADMLGDAKGMIHEIAMYFYVALIAVAVLGQGGMALYYLSRRKYVEAYLRDTPDWVLKMQDRG